MPKNIKKILLVEGGSDKYAIANLMGNYTNWPRDDHPVDIKDEGGVEKILDKVTFDTYIKSCSTLGIVIDADENINSRWESIKTICRDHFPNLPDNLQKKWVISTNQNKRLGVWIMPDNNSNGMMETFLSTLVTNNEGHALLEYSKKVVADAKLKYSAPFINNHNDKAILHSWLAWQNPPGEAFGNAIAKKILDPLSPTAVYFANWFCELFNLERLDIQHQNSDR